MSEPSEGPITVAQVMSENPIIVDGEESVEEAAKRLAGADREGLGCVLVEVNGRVEGILTERDIVCRVVAKGLAAGSTRVKDVMTKPMVAVTPTTTVEEALKIMSKHNIRRLPVVLDNRLVGIVTLTQVAKAINAEWEDMNALLLQALTSQGSSTLEPYA